MTKLSGSSAADGLLLFCDYLAHRVHTENLELLHRIITEFHATPRHFVTVQSLLAIGFPAITIVPVDNGDKTARESARNLRRRVRSGRAPPMDVRAMHDLYTALHGTVELTNWHWLLAIYSDFCTGTEATIKQFVAQDAAIAIFPIAPITGEWVLTDPKPPIGKDSGNNTVAIPVVQDTAECVPSRAEPQAYRYDETIDRIRAAVARVERKAPWERIYDVSKMVYPFNAYANPDLASRLRAFWEKDARAVWERHFWCPFQDTQEVQGTPYYARKLRQQYAATHFAKKVIRPVFNAFGARFFVELDAQPDAIHWWWYRAPVVDLLKMATAVGVERTLQYIETQAKKPAPRLPSALDSNKTRPPSMWSTMLMTQHVANAIDELVEDHVAHAQAKKKRRMWLHEQDD